MSFWGAWLYYAHAKRTLEEVARKVLLSTSARVPWVHIENMAGIEDGESAIGFMSRTAKQKRQVKKPVYTFVLNWHPDQNPTRAQMIEAGRAALKVIGLHEHQAVFVPHTDRAHQHLHIIANRIHPHTLRPNSMSNDQHKLSAWALKYERECGQVLCVKREERALEREEALARGEKKPKVGRKPDRTIEGCWKASRNGQALRSALREKGFELAYGDKKPNVLLLVSKSGRAFSLSRELKISGAEVDRKVSDLDRSTIKSVAQVQREIEASRGGRSGERSQGQPAPRRRREAKAEPKAREQEDALQKAKAAEEAKAQARQKERANFETMASLRRARLQDAQFEARAILSERQQNERLKEEKLIHEHYRKGQEAQRARLQEIQANQSKGGVLYRMTRAKAERAEAQEIQLSLTNGEQRAQEREGALALNHEGEWKRQAEAEQRQTQALEGRIKQEREQKEREGWNPRPARRRTTGKRAGSGREASPRDGIRATSADGKEVIPSQRARKDAPPVRGFRLFLDK